MRFELPTDTRCRYIRRRVGKGISVGDLDHRGTVRAAVTRAGVVVGGPKGFSLTTRAGYEKKHDDDDGGGRREVRKDRDRACLAAVRVKASAEYGGNVVRPVLIYLGI